LVGVDRGSQQVGIDVFPGDQQQQIRFQLSMVLLAIVSQRLLPRADQPGRALAAEFLMNNGAIANLIRDAKTHQVYSVVETSHKEGMITMDRSLKTLFKAGRISHADAVANMRNPKELDSKT
jgi:twitching motility protein PilT